MGAQQKSRRDHAEKSSAGKTARNRSSEDRNSQDSDAQNRSSEDRNNDAALLDEISLAA
jgi:hypothetical protein